jgi:hypothetical protein
LSSCIDLLSCHPLLLHIHLLNHWLPKSDPCIDEPVGHLHYQILESWKVISPCFGFQPLQMFPLGINLLSGGLIHKAFSSKIARAKRQCHPGPPVPLSIEIKSWYAKTAQRNLRSQTK